MLKTVINISGKRLLLPLYHAISDKAPAHLRNLYSVRTLNQFRNDIDFILKYYSPISVPELLDSIHTNIPFEGNRVLFTFDDGLSEIYDVVAPVLKEKDIPAIFFINSAFADNNDLFYRYKASLLIDEIKRNQPGDETRKKIASILNSNHFSQNAICEAILAVDYSTKNILDRIAEITDVNFTEYLKTTKPYLSTDQIRMLQSDGFYIGAHSTDHPEYYKIPFESQIKQTTESIKWIKKEFNTKYNLFAFPFTDYKISKSFFETIHSDKEYKPDLTFGCAGIKDEGINNHIQRIPFEINQFSAKRIIIQEYCEYIAKKIIGKNLIKR